MFYPNNIDRDTKHIKEHNMYNLPDNVNMKLLLKSYSNE